MAVIAGADILPLGVIYLDGENVILTITEILCDVKSKRRKSRGVFAEKAAVEPDLGDCARCFNLKVNGMSLVWGIEVDVFSIPSFPFPSAIATVGGQALSFS